MIANNCCSILLQVLFAFCCIHIVTSSVVNNDVYVQLRSKRAIVTTAGDSNRTLCQPGVEVPSNRVDSTEQLAALRDVMTWPNVTLDAYLISFEDEHINSPADYDRRLEYISGFTGTYGYSWVLGIAGNNKQVLFTDGRYYLQADQQLHCDWEYLSSRLSPIPWLIDALPLNSTVGIDPKLVSVSKWQQYEEALSGSLQLIAVDNELIDYIWTDDRPDRPNEPLMIHHLNFSGVSWQVKVDDVRGVMEEQTADALFISALDDTAWLFNLRGFDRSISPLFYSYAIITQTNIRLYLVNYTKLLTDEVQTHLNTGADGSCDMSTEYCVTVLEYNEVMPDLQSLASDVSVERIWIASSSSYAMYQAGGSKTFVQESPIQIMKAVKNNVERRRYRECQVRDSAAVVDFVSRLETKIHNGEHETELSGSALLQQIRSEDDFYVMDSFGAISAVGANAAVIHYRPSAQTDSNITDQDVYLLDSGGQYFDGTTDVTRTFHFGTPSNKEIEAYTLVLIGVIELATTVWPIGYHGSDIDARTRAKLWQQGLDYNHGTGHGIGYFLNVHEGPGRISMGHSDAHSPLLDGMFFSDEPGYYEDGSFGIRLETIVEVEVKNTTYRFNDVDYLGFNPVTLVPFEPHLINYALLTAEHRRWLNEYNTRCESQTGSYLLSQNKQHAYDWLVKRTHHIPDVPMWGDTSDDPCDDTSGCDRLSSRVISLVPLFLISTFGIIKKTLLRM